MLSIGYVLNSAGRIAPSFRLFKFFLCLLIPVSAYAVQSLDEIHGSSRDFLQNSFLQQGVSAENLRISVNYPDKRLRLESCNVPLTHFMPQYSTNSGNTTVGVRCSSPVWQIYLPAKIEQMVEVLVSNRNFRRGDVISKSELKLIRKPKSQSFQPLSINLSKNKTFRAARNINSGYPISHLDVCQVCKGDQVELQINSEALKVRMFGIAMKDGVSGDFIQARNSKSKKIVTGKVVTQGVLEMKL
jgi:flagella basal body P-ring formation protein FlgA